MSRFVCRMKDGKGEEMKAEGEMMSNVTSVVSLFFQGDGKDLAL